MIAAAANPWMNRRRVNVLDPQLNNDHSKKQNPHDYRKRDRSVRDSGCIEGYHHKEDAVGDAVSQSRYGQGDDGPVNTQPFPASFSIHIIDLEQFPQVPLLEVHPPCLVAVFLFPASSCYGVNVLFAADNGRIFRVYSNDLIFEGISGKIR
jgi:hypothetical protein